MPLDNANIYISCNGYGCVALISMESITEAAIIYMATSIHAAVGKTPYSLASHWGLFKN